VLEQHMSLQIQVTRGDDVLYRISWGADWDVFCKLKIVAHRNRSLAF
jgi:hypothetical protein